MKYTHPDAYNYYIKLFDTLGLDISDMYWLVHEDTLTQNLSNDISLLKEIISTTGKTPLLMYDSNPSWNFEDYFNTLYDNFKDVYLASADLKSMWGQHPNILYFPIFYLEQLTHTNYQNYNKKYRVSFLSNVARFHRIYFYYSVKDFIDNNDCFSVKDFTNDFEIECFKNDMMNILGVYDKNIECTIPFATKNAVICNNLNNTTDKESIDFTNKHVAYESCINVVGESDITQNKVFVSEKTWKSIRSGCIPVFFNPQFNEVLNKLGFDTSNKFNTKLTYLDKIQHIKSFMSTDTLSSVIKDYNAQVKTVIHNVDYFYSDKLKNLFIRHLRDKLHLH